MTDSPHDPHLSRTLPHTHNPAALAKPGGHYSHVVVVNEAWAAHVCNASD
ncbi:hypothetical protein [Paraburkholderia antibiotica]|nr:hypothetical protein [Paraburkholderia antibiotica]